MLKYDELLNLNLISNKPCSKCGRLLEVRGVKQLNRTKIIMFCDCCKYSRNICELVTAEEVEELADGHIILNAEGLTEAAA